MSDSPITFTILPGSDDGRRITLQVAPTPRVCPDGATLQVDVFMDSREEYRNRERVTVPVRVASVSLVDEENRRGAGSGAAVRFAGTLAAPSCWSRVEQSRRYDRIKTGEDYWRVVQSTAWRADGFADDLPDGARRAFFDVCELAAAHVLERFPYLWEGAAEHSAREAVRRAESTLAAARAELTAAKKTLRTAERANVRAVRTHAKKTGATVDSVTA